MNSIRLQTQRATRQACGFVYSTHRTMAAQKLGQNSINIIKGKDGQYKMRDLLISRFPGSRVFEFNDIDNGNRMNLKNLAIMDNRIRVYDDNLIVSAIIFSSTSPELFSLGFKNVNDFDTMAATLSLANKINLDIKNSKKITIANFSGNVSGSAYAVFASSNYKFATMNINFFIFPVYL